MKYSIQKKMFLISLLTTALSFALVLVSFNLITRYHIEQQTMAELSQAVTLAKPITLKINDIGQTAKPDETGVKSGAADAMEKSLSVTLASGSAMTAAPIDGIARDLTATLYAQKTRMDDVGFILSDLSDTSTPARIYSSLSAGSSAASITAEDPAATEMLYSLALNAGSDTPTRAILNDTSYYVVKADIADQADVVFYKNVQPLEDLASEVNLVLLILLAVTGCLTIAMSMGLSRGMVRSIRKLCRFAGDIGAGDLTPRDLDLKERELAVLSDEMNDMISKLAAHDAEQKTFFQNVSHELRTPLMSIQGYAEGIADQVFSGEELNAAAEIILAESDRLTEMVGNLLYLSRMDSPDRSQKKETFDCAEVVEQTVDRVSSLSAAKEKEIAVEFIAAEQTADPGVEDTCAAPRAEDTEAALGPDGPGAVADEDTKAASRTDGPGAVAADSDVAGPKADADDGCYLPAFPVFGCREDFQQAVSSILENALRYAGARITVTIDPARRAIHIADDGPGISEEDMPHIFQRFYKGSGGLSGIGLAIADAAVRGLSGELTAQNVSSGGACFTIRLPEE